MSTTSSLLKASLVGSAAFALPWLRPSHLLSSAATVLHVFIGYGITIFLLSLIVGYPCIHLAERFNFVRLWCFTLVGGILGISLGGILTSSGILPPPSGVPNPFSLTFSPLNRDAPGFVGDTPPSAVDFWGSAGLGAFVGAALGASFWYFYARGRRPLKGIENK